MAITSTLGNAVKTVVKTTADSVKSAGAAVSAVNPPLKLAELTMPKFNFTQKALTAFLKGPGLSEGGSGGSGGASQGAPASSPPAVGGTSSIPTE